MYGADITPNEHKLALQFGVLDNFYDSGEVSGDGHLWSTAAITSDYNEKTWQIAYRGKERTYDFQGQNADEYPLEHNLPDVDDPGTGYLLGQSHPQPRQLPRLRRIRERGVVQRETYSRQPQAGNSLRPANGVSANRGEARRNAGVQCRRTACYA